MMTYNLVKLYHITGEKRYEDLVQEQLVFMSADAERYPAGYAMFLMALSDYMELPQKITIALKENKTTFYICRGHKCLPPVNELV